MKLHNKTAVGKPTPAEQLVQLAAAKAEKEAKKKKAAEARAAKKMATENAAKAVKSAKAAKAATEQTAQEKATEDNRSTSQEIRIDHHLANGSDKVIARETIICRNGIEWIRRDIWRYERSISKKHVPYCEGR